MAGRAISEQIRPKLNFAGLNYAHRMIYSVCYLAGESEYLEELQTSFRKHQFFKPELQRNSAKLFEWLAAAMSYQGISDYVARGYMAQHGYPRYQPIAAGLEQASCPKLQSFWHFNACRYRKSDQSCGEPHHFDHCPLPRHRFRNGNLNQLAYSLFLFIRDVADGDLIGWIDAQISEADPEEPEIAADTLRERLRGVHGVSDKVLNMVLADLLLAAGKQRPLWPEIGGSMIAVDTLVHNFLHRTGILKRARAQHAYGPQCYGEAGCEAVIRAVARMIDARSFDPAFPPYFPRFVQRSIWRYCSEEGLGVCNGRKIDDAGRCRNSECRLLPSCDRLALRGQAGRAASN